MEIAAAVLAATKAVKARIYSDSLSMINRAKMMIGIVYRGGAEGPLEKCMSRAGRKLFQKPFSMQTDGDLWALMWKALAKRGPGQTEVQKVKAHATWQQVESGEVMEEHKIGNDFAVAPPTETYLFKL